jgi:hypothetical protein
MCYGIRAMQAEPEGERGSQPSSGLERLRPRVAGAVAALLVAGFAAAALMEKPAPPQAATEKQSVQTPIAEKIAVPANGVLEQTAAGIDDGVPTALNETKRASGECHHGL